MPVDIAVFADTFFEFPQMYEYHTKFKAWMKENYPKVLMVDTATETTWDAWFHGKVTRGKMKGKVRGWPLSYFPCYWSRETKLKPLEKVCKDNYRYIGYAADEKKRLAGVAISDNDSGYQAPLGEWGWAEKDCLDYLESKGLAEQIHRDFNRTGCYHCPKQPLTSLKIMCKKYPDQWEHIKQMDATSPNDFNPKYTLKEVEDMVHDQMIKPPTDRVALMSKILEELPDSCSCSSGVDLTNNF